MARVKKHVKRTKELKKEKNKNNEIKKNNEIRALIFDVGNVLVRGSILNISIERHHIGAHQYAAKKFKVSIDQYFDSIDTAYAKSIEGKITKHELLKALARNFNTSPAKVQKIFIKAYKRNLKLNKSLLKKIFRLKRKGYKIGILSDQWHFSKEVLTPKSLIEKFDAVVISCDVGMRKPDPKIYKLISKELGIPAKQSVFIDNQEWNLFPARRLGMKTILFHGNKQLFEELKKLGVK